MLHFSVEEKREGDEGKMPIDRQSVYRRDVKKKKAIKNMKGKA